MQQIILDKGKLDAFLNSVAMGFQRKPAEIIITIIIISLVILLPLILFFISRIIKKRKKIRTSRILFRELLSKKQLLEKEKIIMDAVAANCKKEKENLHKLITDVHFFNKYARDITGQDVCTHTELALLRNHLGLHYRSLPVVVESTAQFIQGMPIRLTYQKSGRCKGLVRGVETGGLFIRSEIQPRQGEKVELEFARPAGYYQAFSLVLQVSKNQVVLGHTEKINRIQNRAFPRRRVNLSAAIMPDNSRKLLTTRLLDLSGGGARLKNPGCPLVNNQPVLIYLKQDSQKEPLKIRGRVIRIKGDNTSFSVAFDSIREAVRDRIMRIMK